MAGRTCRRRLRPRACRPSSASHCTPPSSRRPSLPCWQRRGGTRKRPRPPPARWPRMHFVKRGPEALTAQADRARVRLRVRSVALAAAVVVVTLAQAAPEAPSGNDGVDSRLDLLFGEHGPYRTFLGALQAAVAADDRRQVAAMIGYPLKTRLHGQVVHIRTTQQ